MFVAVCADLCLSQDVLSCVSLSQGVLTCVSWGVLTHVFVSRCADLCFSVAGCADEQQGLHGSYADRAGRNQGLCQTTEGEQTSLGGGGGASAQPMCTAGRVLTDLSTSVKSRNGVLQAQKLKVLPGLRSSCPSATNCCCFLSRLGPAG